MEEYQQRYGAELEAICSAFVDASKRKDRAAFDFLIGSIVGIAQLARQAIDYNANPDLWN